MADVLFNARIFGGGVNFSGQSNKVEVGVEVDEIDATVFEPDNPADAGWKARRGGIIDGKAAFSGFWAAGDPAAVDDAMWAALGKVDAWTFVKGAGAVGDVAWSTRALRSKYTGTLEYGKAAAFEGAVSGSWGTVRGRVAHPHTVARSGAGSGSDVVLAAGVPAGQYLYAALHVLSVAGTAAPTLSVVVESDDTSGFTSAIQRLAFDPVTAPAGQIIRAAGPLTDTHVRVRWSMSGTSPSFLFAATLGVAPA
jgi:hypothetical protein